MSFIHARSRELGASITSPFRRLSAPDGLRGKPPRLHAQSRPARPVVKSAFLHGPPAMTSTVPSPTLSALSPLDGRYASKTDKLRPILSEAGFMHHRVKVEIAWLQALSQAGFPEIKPFSPEANAHLERMAANFSSRSTISWPCPKRTTER